MTQTIDLLGNTIKADGFIGAVTGAVTGAVVTTSPVTIGTVGVYVGAGAPSALTAAQGSLYLNTTGSSSSTRAYINTTGSTTWTPVTTVG